MPNPTKKELDRAKELIKLLRGEELGAPYVPTSDSCNTLDTEVPDTMAYEMHEALEKIEKKVAERKVVDLELLTIFRSSKPVFDDPLAL